MQPVQLCVTNFNRLIAQTSLFVPRSFRPVDQKLENLLFMPILDCKTVLYLLKVPVFSVI